MELRGEWTATWRTTSDGGLCGGSSSVSGGGGGGAAEDVIVDGDVFFNDSSEDSSGGGGGEGGVFFRELSTNARGAAEAESLCVAAGIGHVWETTSRSGKGAPVSATLRWGSSSDYHTCTRYFLEHDTLFHVIRFFEFFTKICAHDGQSVQSPRSQLY